MDDVQKLLKILPADAVSRIEDPDDLIEIVLDLGRPLELRYNNDEYVLIEDYIVSTRELNYIISRIGDFGIDNRAGIDSTLHRISRIQNRHEEIVGLTCRVGKPFFGSVDLIKDLVLAGKNILLLGAPGIGKTTKLRDVARFLSTEAEKRVVIVDTSNEIAGDGDIAHPAVGRARRLQVPFRKSQHSVMIEAVENHTPQVVIIDEISEAQEAEAARTISQRGVQLIATAHGQKLEDLIMNPPLCGLIGGIKDVTISDEQQKLRGLESKTVLTRKYEPAFDVVIELHSYDEISIHHNIRDAVDAQITGGVSIPEQRIMTEDGVKTTRPAKIAFPQGIREHRQEKPVITKRESRPSRQGRSRRG